MRKIPVLFSTPMVIALNENRKTQTRRTKGLEFLLDIRFEYGLDKTPFERAGEWYYQLQIAVDDCREYKLKCPYGQIDDILWVKEMYYAYGMWLRNGKTKSGVQKWKFLDTTQTGFNYRYCNNPPENILPNTKRETYGWFKRSSLFMPYKAYRIKLEITDIRIERLQDISVEDAIAEGIEYVDDQRVEGYDNLCRIYLDYVDIESINLNPKESYQSLWVKLNGKESWNKNPWVWAIEFNPIQL